MNRKSTLQARFAFLLFLLIGFTSNAVARDEVKRFDNGPFFSAPNEFLAASSDALNEPENSPARLRAIALLQRTAGSREAHQDDIARRNLDELARYYIMSVDGWMTNSVMLNMALTFSKDDNTRDIADALENSIVRSPGGSHTKLPLGQRIRLSYGDMLSTGGALLERGEPRNIGGQYLTEVRGDCSFDSGPVDIIQDQFLFEGRRDDSLLFWGAVGETRAYLTTAENKYLKLTFKRRGKRAQVEFPDKSSELFSAAIDSAVLSFTGEFFGDCEIKATNQAQAPHAPPERSTRFNRRPPEQMVERIDTSGVSLTMEEVSRSGKGRKLEITYRFVAKGFPAGVTYSFWKYKPQQKPVKVLSNLSVDQSGVMFVNELGSGTGDRAWEPVPLESAVPLTLFNLSPGELFEFGIVSEDQTIQAFARVFPRPIETRQGICYLYLERLNVGQTSYRAYATGLVPGEELRIESESGGVVLRSSSQADENGKFSAYVFPEVAGKAFGAAEYRVRAESCSLSIGYEWGVRRSKR